MGVWGIDNYQPRWCNSLPELSSLLVQTPLVGLQITSIWSLWDGREDEWFDDAPIVICTPENQVEFCATKLDEFSFSLDSVDLSVPVYWCEGENPDGEPFHWVQQQNVEFNDLVRKVILGVEIIEYGSIEPDVQTFLGVDAWVLSGIALQFEDDRLEIINGLDRNVLSRSPHPWEGLRYTLVENKI